MTFKSFMQKVDRELIEFGGFMSLELPDIDYHGLYEDGVSPKEAAQIALANAGWEG